MDRETFMEQVVAARGSDAWISRGRLDAGLVGVAVRLTDRRGEIRAAIGMTLQAAFWEDARIAAELVPGLQDTVAQLRQIV